MWAFVCLIYHKYQYYYRNIWYCITYAIQKSPRKQLRITWKEKTENDPLPPPITHTLKKKTTTIKTAFHHKLHHGWNWWVSFKAGAEILNLNWFNGFGINYQQYVGGLTKRVNLLLNFNYPRHIFHKMTFVEGFFKLNQLIHMEVWKTLVANMLLITYEYILLCYRFLHL